MAVALRNYYSVQIYHGKIYQSVRYPQSPKTKLALKTFFKIWQAFQKIYA